MVTSYMNATEQAFWQQEHEARHREYDRHRQMCAMQSPYGSSLGQYAGYGPPPSAEPSPLKNKPIETINKTLLLLEDSNAD